jgi:hypothetical protein
MTSRFRKSSAGCIGQNFICPECGRHSLLEHKMAVYAASICIYIETVFSVVQLLLWYRSASSGVVSIEKRDRLSKMIKKDFSTVKAVQGTRRYEKHKKLQALINYNGQQLPASAQPKNSEADWSI